MGDMVSVPVELVDALREAANRFGPGGPVVASNDRGRWSEIVDAARAVVAAASGPWAEQLDAAKAEHERVLQGVKDCWKVDMKDAREQRDRAEAALARNAELEERLRETNEDADSLDERLTQASRDCLKLRTERNEARELLADVEDRVARNQPWMPSYVEAMKRLRKATADNLALRAELDNLRETLAQKIEEAVLTVDHVLASKADRMVALMDVKKQIVALVRGTDDAGEDE